MIKRLAALALLTGLAAAPAMAVTYDAFTSFNGTNGNGGFTYGSFDGTDFTPFSGATGCNAWISGVTCLGDLPGAFKTTSGAHVSGTVNVPGDALILHPGSGNNPVYIEFTVATAGIYTLTPSFSVQDINPTGVDLSFFVRIGGVLLGIQPLGSLSASNPTFTLPAESEWLGVGDSIGFIIDKGEVYNNDSTGVNMTMATVPEPATWGLMIVGFGLVGVASRRRMASTPSRSQAALAA